MYQRIEVTVTTKTGCKVTCFTYIMRDDAAVSLPSKPYLDTLIAGAREHSISNI